MIFHGMIPNIDIEGHHVLYHVKPNNQPGVSMSPRLRSSFAAAPFTAAMYHINSPSWHSSFLQTLQHPALKHNSNTISQARQHSTPPTTTPALQQSSTTHSLNTTLPLRRKIWYLRLSSPSLAIHHICSFRTTCHQQSLSDPSSRGIRHLRRTTSTCHLLNLNRKLRHQVLQHPTT
jgi:hypothetical protein